MHYRSKVVTLPHTGELVVASKHVQPRHIRGSVRELAVGARWNRAHRTVCAVVSTSRDPFATVVAVPRDLFRARMQATHILGHAIA